MLKSKRRHNNRIEKILFSSSSFFLDASAIFTSMKTDEHGKNRNEFIRNVQKERKELSKMLMEWAPERKRRTNTNMK